MWITLPEVQKTVSQKILCKGVKDTQHPLAVSAALDMLSPAYGSPRIIGTITCRSQTNIKRQRELMLSHKNSSCLSVRAFVLQKKIQTRQTRFHAMLVLVPNILELPVFKINDDATCVASHFKFHVASPHFLNIICAWSASSPRRQIPTSCSACEVKILFVPSYLTSIDLYTAKEYSYALQPIVAVCTYAFLVLRACPWKLKETSTATLKAVGAA